VGSSRTRWPNKPEALSSNSSTTKEERKIERSKAPRKKKLLKHAKECPTSFISEKKKN
jgi:hypothetical protein